MAILIDEPPKKKRGFLYPLFLVFLVALLGLAVAAYIAFKNIPSTANINSCFTTSMYQVELCPTKSSYVKFNQLPKHLVAALIASEDASFYFHKGFDWDEIRDSLEKSFDAGRWVRGGSTLTQQLAKNLYLSKERSLYRKLKEFFIAKELESKLSKPQIIEKYFNVVEFGKNVYGIRKAATYYFQKSPGELTAAESAYLISLLPSPVRYSAAFRNNKELSAFNKKRVTRILSLLRGQGKISEDDYIYETARTEVGLWSPFPIEENPLSAVPPYDANPAMDIEDEEDPDEDEAPEDLEE